MKPTPGLNQTAYVITPRHWVCARYVRPFWQVIEVTDSDPQVVHGLYHERADAEGMAIALAACLRDNQPEEGQP